MDAKSKTLKALLELSCGKETSLEILVDSIFNGSIEIVDATKAAKELCYSFCEVIVITVIADCFNDNHDKTLEMIEDEDKAGFNIYRNDTKVGYLEYIFDKGKQYKLSVSEVT